MAEFGPPSAITQQELLNALSRSFEDHWIQGLYADPSSLSVFVGMCAAFLRVQTAGDENLDVNGYILSAKGATPSQSLLTLQRPSGAAGTIDQSLRLRDQFGNVWRPTGLNAIASSVGQQTVNIAVQSERTGYYLNQFLAPSFQLLDTPFDPTFAVVQGTTPAAGGTGALLDLHGSERQVPRSSGEPDPTYRHRMLLLPDQVSPSALASVIPTILAAYPATATAANLISGMGLRAMIEPFTDSAQIAITGLAGEPMMFFDDAFADDPSGPRMRDYQDAAAEFDVFLPTPTDATDIRLFWDDGYFDDPANGYLDIDQAGSPGYVASLAALADTIDKKRPAGVKVRIIVGEPARLLRHPAALNTAGAWVLAGTANPPASTIVQALATHDGDLSYVRTRSGTSAGQMSDGSDLLAVMPVLAPAPQSVGRLVLRAQARWISLGTGVFPNFAFVLSTPGANATWRMLGLGGFPAIINHADWREYTLIVERNPFTGQPWALSDVSGFGSLVVGVANPIVAASCDELRVSELSLDVVASYG